MKLTAFKRIIVEEFNQDDQEVVKGLASLLNPIIDQLAILFDKRLDFLNINRQYKQVEIQVSATGAPISSLQIKSELRGKCIGINCIRAETTGTAATSCPLISFSEDQGIINISNITNLNAASKYTLTLELIGGNT